jgi:hypothetical protein
VAGDERKLFVERAQIDYTDYALIGSARWSVEEGELVLRIPLSSSD